jgi:hypothetical protein
MVMVGDPSYKLCFPFRTAESKESAAENALEPMTYVCHFRRDESAVVCSAHFVNNAAAPRNDSHLLVCRDWASPLDRHLPYRPRS